MQLGFGRQQQQLGHYVLLWSLRRMSSIRSVDKLAQANDRWIDEFGCSSCFIIIWPWGSCCISIKLAVAWLPHLAWP
ncbi:hypothetical protein ACLKA7_006423 [Drosophila subpalustris]